MNAIESEKYGYMLGLTHRRHNLVSIVKKMKERFLTVSTEEVVLIYKDVMAMRAIFKSPTIQE